MTLQVEIQDLRMMLKEKCEEIISDKKLAYEFYWRICDIEEDSRFTIVDNSEIVRCKDCIHWDKGHTEECGNLDSVCFHNGWCKPDWFCADGERRTDNA